MENEEKTAQEEAWLPEEESETDTESTAINEAAEGPAPENETAAPSEKPAEARAAGAGEPASGSKRDFMEEVDVLLKTYPEAIRNGGLPEEVRREALKGKNVSLAYTEYRLRQLEAENRQLRHNARNAAAAPVLGSGGFQAAADDFTKGFDSEY